MPELNRLTNEQIIAIKDDILKDVDHNKPKMRCTKKQGFLDALSIGSDRFSDSPLKDLTQNFNGEE